MSFSICGRLESAGNLRPFMVPMRGLRAVVATHEPRSGFGGLAGSKAVLKPPQSKPWRAPARSRAARSVWTAAASAPLFPGAGSRAKSRPLAGRWFSPRPPGVAGLRPRSGVEAGGVDARRATPRERLRGEVRPRQISVGWGRCEDGCCLRLWRATESRGTCRAESQCGGGSPASGGKSGPRQADIRGQGAG